MRFGSPGSNINLISWMITHNSLVIKDDRGSSDSLLMNENTNSCTTQSLQIVAKYGGDGPQKGRKKLGGTARVNSTNFCIVPER